MKCKYTKIVDISNMLHRKQFKYENTKFNLVRVFDCK